MGESGVSVSRARIVVSDVRKEFASPAGTIEVLRGVSLEMAAGEAASVVGPSGSGKSTLLNIIGSLDRPTSGAVTVDGKDLTGLSDDELAGYRSRSVGFVFQEHHLLPQCTALENVMLPTLAAGGSGGAADRAGALLDGMGLAERAGSFPAQLSGGERQRVAVARALINDPGILLCDEPTGSLDRASAEVVAELLAGLVSEKDLSLIVVTHNMEIAGRFDRVLSLEGGILKAAGP